LLEKRNAQPVVILSQAFWQTRFGGNEAALGQPLSLNGREFTIIGVLPPGFEFPLARANTEILTTIAGEGGNLAQRGAQVLIPLGRLQAGATLARYLFGWGTTRR
jgi:putative ABC transport system permease protein